MRVRLLGFSASTARCRRWCAATTGHCAAWARLVARAEKTSRRLAARFRLGSTMRPSGRSARSTQEMHVRSIARFASVSVCFGSFLGTFDAAFAEDEAAWTKTPSGLEYYVVSRGPEGPKPTTDSGVRVHYTGKLEDGRVFDSSRIRGAPAEFELGRVIKGWTEGLQLMQAGDRFEFRIPADLGYGARGAGNVIPPNATLSFDVELFEIVPPFTYVAIDEAKAKSTESGLKYEVVEAGSGDLLTEQAMELRFALFDGAGKVLTSSLREGQILGRGAEVAERMGGSMFAEVPELMQVGTTLRCVAPASMAFRDPARVGMQADTPTYWEIKATRAVKVPAFVAPDESKLTTTESGLKYQFLSRGSDPDAKQPKENDGVAVDYAGWLQDGTPFDSSYSRATRFVTELEKNGLIDGWIEGIQLMKEGDRILLVVPPALGYGANGSPPKIPADATLVFVIELHKVP
ncbi:MAG: FKBP-type peptidyl-prolyl cis-trans isomerase [Planctomycetes bacterium]|nr:FKBP-type peptidyl-prolyl cis-trans isomerase [Planctomycetota bacterium]MCC7169291.1 FKBP-type peptidyl-prolyl cis-trans isomerase [Planctomycetota bacterium]